jgi:excisionase family DNA binding protein
MTATTSPFVQIEDVANHFSVSVSTVRTWVRQNNIPKDTYIKVGHTYRFHLDNVVAALTSAPKQLELELDQETTGE